MRKLLRLIWKVNLNKSQKIFTEIYENNSWNSEESRSGSGSTLEQTRVIRGQLVRIFNKYQIKSILDIPCGDFNWMQKVDLNGIYYIGGDIVRSLIKLNKKKYRYYPNVSFKHLDITKDKLPNVDLIFVRDCFVHLSFEEIARAIQNIKRSGSKFLFTTTFTDRQKNENTEFGGWRVLNLEIEPFNLSNPLLILNEQCTEENGEYKDKCMALYLIDEL